MKGKNKINIVFLLTSLFFIILFSGYVSASCMIQGQVFSEEGTPLNGINVNVSIDGNNPSQTTTSSGVFGEGYYEQSFESECVQGDSSVYVKAYNSTHYGENTTTADSSA